MPKDNMKIAKTATEALKIVWENNIFIKPKNVKEISCELEKKGYNFPDAALLMALKRANFLTRKGTRGNYTYVQMHPFIEEREDIQ